LINNLATLAETRGNFPVAIRLYQQALEEARAVKDKGSVALAQNNLGGIYSLQGNFGAALENIQEAVKAAEETGSKSNEAQFLYNLGELKLEQGDLAGAEESIQAGLKIATEIGEKSVIAFGQSCLSDLRLQGGNAGEAEKLARQAADEFHSEGNKDPESMSRNALAAALLALNRPDDAAKEMELVAKLSPQDAVVKLGAAINLARIEARSGNIARAKRQLEASSAEAKKSGIPPMQFEAQLAQGELALFGGDKREALSFVLTIEKAAAKKGFRQYEARARQLAAQIHSG
jgi:tetratricopeptide (TPR) repeat protein